MLTVDTLFEHADIDDITDHEDLVELVFTIRRTASGHQVWGEDLEDCMMQARDIVARELTLDDLRAEGLSDADIDRLAADRFDAQESYVATREGEAWDRGYEAGINDAVRNAIIAQQAIATSQPAAAAAAQPFTVTPTIIEDAAVAKILDQHPLISITYVPTAVVQHQKI